MKNCMCTEKTTLFMQEAERVLFAVDFMSWSVNPVVGATIKVNWISSESAANIDLEITKGDYELQTCKLLYVELEAFVVSFLQPNV